MDLRKLSDATEEVSVRYAERYGIDRSDTWFLLKLTEEVGELTQAYLVMSGQGRRKGRSDGEADAQFRAELADVLAHTLLLARRFDVDLQAEVDKKWLSRLAGSAPSEPAAADRAGSRVCGAEHAQEAVRS